MAEDDSTTKSLRDRFFEIAESAIGAPATAERPKPEQLGLWPDDLRGCPNVMLRAALFSAAKPRKLRKLYRDQELPAAIGTKTITYTGPQLYQFELDVWLEAIHRCRLRPAGVETDFHARGFLRSLRRSDGKANYKQLLATLGLLHATSVQVIPEDPSKQGYRGHLLEACRFDQDLLRYRVSVNPELAELFVPKEHTWLHLDARLDLGKNYLAKWCHGYFSSHRKPHPIGVQRLHELSGSANTVLRDFRRSLREALAEIARVEKSHRRRFEWRIDEADQVHVVRQSDN